MTKNNKQTYYPDVSSNANFSQIEEQVLEYWKSHNSFKQSIENRSNSSDFIFFDGPPFANGLPHYGHLLSGFVKDTYARFQTIKGKKVERRFGWDCHGLPAEMHAEKELGFSGRIAINEFGIDKFNETCKKSVMKYADDWEEYVDRQARWVDFKNSYKTMDIEYMQSVLSVFKKLYNKGLIYQSMRVMPYSWACETPLSNFETRLDNSYRERADKAVTCSFVLTGKLPFELNCEEYRIVAWTTTPWTLPSNLALAVGAEIDYALVVKDKICYIIGKFSLENYAKELSYDPTQTYKIIKGKDLIGLSYKPLLDYFANHKNAFRIFEGEFVVEGDGTGVVHIAPGFGEDDYALCLKHEIELVCPIDNGGKFTAEIPDFQSMQVFDANDPIIIKLKNQGNWVKTEQYIHSYPHCWRTDTPLIYKAVPSWYVKVTEIRDRMCELNQGINWIPNHIKDGLFGKWIENARDWSISRNRFWGTPIPVWVSDDPTHPRIDVYGSIAALEADFGVKITDLHRPFIDSLTRPNPDDPSGKSMMRRVKDVFDCWFESGSMPYAQVGHLFSDDAEFEQKKFQADFIVEYSAQTRGWFYTLMVLSTALCDAAPFLNCICHGVILDSTGQKLSKRLNNYADPLELFNLYGADALRATMLSSTVVIGQDLLIDKEGKMVSETLRLFIKPIWNAYHFFTLYANADEIQGQRIVDYGTYVTSKFNSLDYYILAKLKIAIELIEKGLSEFDTQTPYKAVEDFFEVLNNWYIRTNRKRFWKSEKDKDKQDAYNVLYTCLITICEAMSPILPLISESIYLGLTQNKASVHLQDFPKIPQLSEWVVYPGTALEYGDMMVDMMDRVKDICSTVRFLRQQANVRVRQPLQKLTVITKTNELNLENQSYDLYAYQNIIQEECNIKEIEFKADLENYATEKLSINFSVVGKTYPREMKTIIAASKTNQWEWKKDSADKIIIAGVELWDDQFSIVLESKLDTEGTKALSDNSGLVALDLTITPELEQEGIARDIIRLVQQARKEADFDISDRVQLEILADSKVTEAVKKFTDLIQEQTLSELKVGITESYSVESKLDDCLVTIKLNRIIIN